MKQTKNQKKNNIPGKPISLKYLAAVWAVVLLIVVIVIVIWESNDGKMLQSSTYDIISIVVSFSSFLATSFFSISIYNHNASIREQNYEIRRQTQSVNHRAELFRNLQFIASNYTIIDFHDSMALYEEYPQYTKKLKDEKNFQFYMSEKGVLEDDVLKNFGDYWFLTVRVPIKIIEGKTIGRICFTRIKFVKADETYRFYPILGGHDNPGGATSLILYNEKDGRQEVVINLITKKDSGFYSPERVDNFLKIKVHTHMESLLGVVVSGAIELYFTNPEKIEKGGISKYKINSSQFELDGKPKLNVPKELEPD